MSEDPLSRIRRLTHERAYADKVEEEWRRAVIEAVDQGIRVAEIATAAEVSRTRVYQINRER